MSEKSTGFEAVRSLLVSDAIRYGEPRSFSGLTLVPLFSVCPGPFEYVLLSTAIRTGTAAIEEVGLGHVPTLRIINRSAMPVLLRSVVKVAKAKNAATMSP